MGFYQIFFFAALLKTGVAVGTMITIGSAPIIAGILGKVLFHEQIERKWYLATFLAVVGCILLAWPSGEFGIELTGVLLALGAGSSWALSGSCMKMLPGSRSSIEKAGIMLLLGSLIISPVLLLRDLSWFLSLRGVLVVSHLSIMATALPYVLFALGIVRIKVSTAYTLTLSEPLTASCLGIFLLGEELTGPVLAGILLIFAGLVILSVGRKRTKTFSPGLESSGKFKP